MFEYAASRAIALRNDAELRLDPWSGFVRDRVFRRTFVLDALPIQARRAGRLGRLPFWYERIVERYRGAPTQTISSRPWGLSVRELAQTFYPEVADLKSRRSMWLYGHWQSEAYFADCRDRIAAELSPPAPSDDAFRRMGALIDSTNAVAIGVRLYEEMPGASKAVVGGLTDMEFYVRSAAAMATVVPNPVFFVFSSTLSSFVRDISLPGPAHYVTSDNGFEDAIGSLWLMAQCKHHVIANSSLYWWGAWLAEQRRPGTRIIASGRFTNPATIPPRWESWPPERAAS